MVEAPLGHGGMGSVYRCHNAATTRIMAAVKVLDSAMQDTEEAQQRFLREAEILFRLDHPNIVRVRNVRMDGIPPYIEMEYVEGEPLERRISAGATAPQDAMRWVAELVDALVYMHARGVRHRDIKPSNLIVTASGSIKLVDFGLAMEADLGRITAEGLSFGTVSYAPPEWVDPKVIDPVQWDLYAVGVVLWELLTGSFAFPLSGDGPQRKQLLEVMVQKQSAGPLDPGPEFSSGIRDLVRRLTAGAVSKRPQSAEELQALVSAVVPASRPDGAVSDVAVRTELPRRVFLAAGAVVGALAILLGVAILGTQSGPAAPSVVPLPAPLQVQPVRVHGIPPGMPLELRIGSLRVPVQGGKAQLIGAPADEADVTWVAGADCAACPGVGCPTWCGVGVVQRPAAGAELVIGVQVPRATVTVHLPELVEATSGKLLQKKRPIWNFGVRVGDRVAERPNHYTGVARGVPPGRHRVVATIGGCPEEAFGCWPDGRCPSRCRSGEVQVVVPWGATRREVTIGVPLPP